MEPPGTAPGSDPCITGAFIAIVPVARDVLNIGGQGGRLKTVESRNEKGPRPAARPLSFHGGAQNPALIFSNSSSIRSRTSVGIGVCDSSVVSIGLTSAATSSSIGISAIAASFAWA